MAVGDRSRLELSSLNHTDASSNRSDVHIVSDSNGVQAEKLGDEQYPHGLKLVLLAGASIVAVFLIALDQVSTCLNRANTERILLT